MATYEFACASCGEIHEVEHTIGTAPRTARCPCGKVAKLRIGAGVNIAAAATPTAKPHVVAGNLREKRFDRDGAAYKRMRARGLQPPQIDGSASMENTVGDQADIDYRRALKTAETAGGGGKERVLEAVASIEPTH